MPVCDLCNSPGMGTLISADQMRKAVSNGFNPSKEIYIVSKIWNSNILNETQSYSSWKNMVLQDTSDWNICNECMIHLRKYLNEAPKPKNIKQSSYNPFITDPVVAEILRTTKESITPLEENKNKPLNKTNQINTPTLNQNKKSTGKVVSKNESFQKADKSKNKNPIISLILSFFIPSLGGQVYDGHYVKGIILFLAIIILSIIGIGYIGFIIWIYGMYDAYVTAKRINKGEKPKDWFRNSSSQENKSQKHSNSAKRTNKTVKINKKNTNNDLITCPKCKTKNNIEHDYCLECGYKLTEPIAYYWLKKKNYNKLTKMGEIAIKPLTESLDDNNNNYLTRIEAVKALEKIGNPRAVEPLINALKDKYLDVRSHAAEALGRIGDPRAVEPLIEALKDENGFVSKTVAEALANIGEPSVKPLIKALKNSDSCLRSNAAGTLGLIGDVRAVEPLIKLLNDKDMGRPAANALSEIANNNSTDPDVKDKVTKVLENRKIIKHNSISKSISEKQSNTLKKTNNEITDKKTDIATELKVDSLIFKLKDTDPSVRESSVEKIVNIGESAVLPLIEYLKNENEWARLMAATALGKIGDERAITPLKQLLNDKDEGVRYITRISLDNLENINKPNKEIFNEIGVLFDIDKLGGWYGAEAYKIFFKNLNPMKMSGFILYDGDTTETLNGNANNYCIAVQSMDPSTINYIKDSFSQANNTGLSSIENRFIMGNVTPKHPLVLSARVNSGGRINLTGDYTAIRVGAKDTEWIIN